MPDWGSIGIWLQNNAVFGWFERFNPGKPFLYFAN